MKYLMAKVSALFMALILLVSNAALAETTENEFTFGCPRHGEEKLCTKCGWVSTRNSICTVCNGSGRMTCFYCRGYGKTDGGQKHGIKKYKCTGCSGEGKRKCSNCMGSGKGLSPTKFCPECKPAVGVVCGICLDCDGTNISTDWTQYEKFVYRNVMREPETHLGKFFCVTGSVSSVTRPHSKTDQYQILLTSSENGIDYQYSMMYFPQEGAEKLLRGDQINAYGRFVSYDNQDIPAFVVFKADLIQ